MASILNLRYPLPVFRTAREIVNGPQSRFALKGLRCHRAALVISPSFKKAATCDSLVNSIACDDLLVLEKSWPGEPGLEGLGPDLAKLETFQPDVIIALGGGSVLDGAKLLWALYECPESDAESLKRPFSLPPLGGRARFVAIPTTLGSGSEVSSAAVILDESDGRKHPVITHDFLAHLVILDPELVADVPFHALVPTLGDALSHAVEGFVSQVSHPLTEPLAATAVRLIAGELDKLEKNRNFQGSIDPLQQAALLAGQVQNHCLTGLSHCIAHQLGSFGVSHSRANTGLMDRVIELQARDEDVAAGYGQLAYQAGLAPNADALITLFRRIQALCDRPLDIPGLKPQMDHVVQGALEDASARVNPVEITPALIEEVLSPWL